MAEEIDEVEESRPEDVRPDGTPSFDINSSYQSAYLKSNYESDEYHELKIMEDDLNTVVNEEILKLDKFASLRPIDAKILVPEYEIKINNEKKAKIVRAISDKLFVVRLNDGSELEINILNIEPAVDPVMKLKKPQVRELYRLCFEALINRNKQAIDIVYFFYVFTNHFKINEHYMFSCLREKTQGELVAEITKRTGIKFDKTGINPMFVSSL